MVYTEKEVSNILNIPVEIVINELDRGMWDILVELNRKNYFTYACCEGHLKENGSWNGYIGFKDSYDFKEYPKNYDSAKQRKVFFWSGVGEENRKEFLINLYEWALSLPVREVKDIKFYTLWGKNKKRPNSSWRVLRTSNNYNDIRVELNRKQTGKYETKLDEKIIGRY